MLMGEMKSRAVTIGAVEVITALPAGVTVTPWEATTVEGPVPMTRLTLPPEKHGTAGGLPTASQQCALAQGSLDRLVKAHSPAHQFTGQVALFGDDHGYFWELCI